MPFSFARLFLGKKATIIDEDSLPCQPREIVPLAVDAKPVTFKTKFGLTKIGQALKHKLHLDTAYTIPTGHGPLVVAADEPFMPFSRCLQSPTTPSFQSLPHIPDVSSTLRRDFRNATRFALLAAAEEANSLTSSNDIYISTPCRKRRTRSSSVLGGSELPRPETPLLFESPQLPDQVQEHESLASPIPTYLITPVDSPLIWENDQVSDEVSTDSSEYNERPDVLPLNVHQQHPVANITGNISAPGLLHWGYSDHDIAQPPPLFVGRASTEAIEPAPRGNWFTWRYIQDLRNWSMPIISASEPPSSPRESWPSPPRLNSGLHEAISSSSVYSSFPSPENGNTGTSSQKSFPHKSQLTTYTPVKLGEQAEFFPGTVQQSPPAAKSAREAQIYNGRELSLIETTDVSSLKECDCRSASEAFYHSEESEDHAPALEAPNRHLECIFEPRPSQFIFGSIDEAPANTSEDDYVADAAFGDRTTDGESKHYGAIGASLMNTVLFHRLRENSQVFRRESLMLRQIVRHAPEAIFRQGPENQVRIISTGASRFITGFDLFASEEKHGLIGMASTPMSCSSSTKENIDEALTTHPDQVGTTMPPLSTTDGFQYPFIPKVYQTTIADAATIASVTKCPTLPKAPPRNKQVTFARVRRAVTVGGTINEEQEATYKRSETNQGMQGSGVANLLAEWPDLKEDWHNDDQDFLHIGNRVSDYEVSRKDRRREMATKVAINCLQSNLASANTKLMNMTCLETSLASANTRLMNMESLERALDQRHEGHVHATEQLTELGDQVSILKAREDSGKIVFDRMMADELIEIASKDKEIETLRELCNNEPVAKELAGLHEALRESRHSKIEYLQHAEESFKLVKRTDDRHSLAEQQMQTAKMAQTFAEVNQRSAEEYHENLKERIVELESERDQACKARDDALAEVERRQHAQTAEDIELVEPVVSMTPVGTPSGCHERQDHVDEYEMWESGLESEGEHGPPTEGVTEELEEHDWDDSDIF